MGCAVPLFHELNLSVPERGFTRRDMLLIYAKFEPVLD